MSVFSCNYDEYRLGAAIGFGAASIVYAAVHSPTSPPGSKASLCAVKISTRYADPEQLLEEVRLLSSCRHPNVLQIYAAFTIPPEHYQVAIVTPLLAGGSLLSLMAWRATLPSQDQPSGLFRSLSGKNRTPLSNGRLIEEEIKAVLKQVLSGLGYLHSQGIVHRDIKAGNILVDADGTVLLGDLGIGVRPVLQLAPKAIELAGSPCWMAPEIITGQRSDHKSDIWSLGITLIELSTGSAPSVHLPPAKILTQIAVAPPPALPPSVDASKAYLSFLDSCLVKGPTGRSDVPQLERHAFLRNARKAPWLAEVLLKGVPPLVDRQELRRAPSHHSLLSLASSWNFNPTPAGSALTTPVRITHRLPRSPSASTTASNQLFAAPYRRRRSASRSSAGYSVPPSPKASMSRASWMAPLPGPGGAEELWMGRTGSEPGRRRTLGHSEKGKEVAGSPDIAEPIDVPSATETDPRPLTPPASKDADVLVSVMDSGTSPVGGRWARRAGLFSWRRGAVGKGAAVGQI